MGIRDRLIRMVALLIFERPARRTTLANLAAKLEMSGKDVERRISVAPDNEQNRGQIRHFIGIERWGQQRVRVALGNPLTLDEYDDYQPAANLLWEQMRTAFQDTRRETLALVQELERAGAGADAKIPHNQFGDLSVGAWLQYLHRHANMESRRLR
jgi:hypothetical protein